MFSLKVPTPPGHGADGAVARPCQPGLFEWWLLSYSSGSRRDGTDPNFSLQSRITQKTGQGNAPLLMFLWKSKQDVTLFFFFFFFFFLRFLFTYLESGEGNEKERKRNINVWLPLTCPQLGTWPATQACDPIWNQTSNPLVRRPAHNPLSYTSQGNSLLYFPHNLHFYKCTSQSGRSLHLCPGAKETLDTLSR